MTYRTFAVQRALRAVLLGALVLSPFACSSGGSSDDDDDDDDDCDVGEEGCRCSDDGACFTGLLCVNERCRDPGPASGGKSGAGGGGAGGKGGASSGGKGGASGAGGGSTGGSGGDGATGGGSTGGAGGSTGGAGGGAGVPSSGGSGNEPGTGGTGGAGGAAGAGGTGRAGSGAGGGAGMSNPGGVEIIAEETSALRHIRVAGDDAYYVVGTGTIRRVPKVGGAAPATLVTETEEVQALEVGEEQLIYTREFPEEDVENGTERFLLALDRAGGEPYELQSAGDGSDYLGINRFTAYWVAGTWNGDHDLYRVDTLKIDAPEPIAVSIGHLALTTNETPELHTEVITADVGGSQGWIDVRDDSTGVTTTVHEFTYAGGMGTVYGLAADDTHVFWYMDGSVFRSTRAAGSGAPLAAVANKGIGGFVLDDSAVYFASGSEVLRLPKDSATATPFATGVLTYTDVQVDATHVYYQRRNSAMTTYQLVRVAK